MICRRGCCRSKYTTYVRIVGIYVLTFHNESINSVEHRPNAIQQKIKRTIEPVRKKTCQKKKTIIDYEKLKTYINVKYTNVKITYNKIGVSINKFIT